MNNSIAVKKEAVRIFIKKILSEKGKDKNYVNKRMQDSIVNFFLEDYVIPLFSIKLSLHDVVSRKMFHCKMVEESRKKDDNQCSGISKQLKYVKLLNEYYAALKKEGLLDSYNKMLVQTIL